MGERVRLSYGEMEDNCGKLLNVAGRFSETSEEMKSIVSTFTGVWEGDAEEIFESDYDTLKKSLDQTTEVLNEITQLAQKYIAQMREVESNFAKSHVSIS